MGKTKVFLRAGQMAELDARRTEILAKAARQIQRQIRTYLIRKEFITLKKATIHMQKLWRGNWCHFWVVCEITYVLPRSYTVASSFMQMQKIRRLDSMNCTKNMIIFNFSAAIIFPMRTSLRTGLGLKQPTRWVPKGILGHSKNYRSNPISTIHVIRRSRKWLVSVCSAAQLARNLYEHMRKEAASIRVQKHVRAHAARKSYTKLQASAIAIQTGLRAMAARNECRRRRKNKAATIVQVIN